jgi:hypothetical protein
LRECGEAGFIRDGDKVAHTGQALYEREKKGAGEHIWFNTKSPCVPVYERGSDTLRQRYKGKREGFYSFC